MLLLRRFGLSVARIGEMLSAGQPDLTSMLKLQAQALEEQRLRVFPLLVTALPRHDWTRPPPSTRHTPKR